MWDIRLTRWTKDHGYISLLPRVSRVRHIGVQGGINFNIDQKQQQDVWLSVYIPTESVDYDEKNVNYVNWNPETGLVQEICTGYYCPRL
jgi:hypothetical protein